MARMGFLLLLLDGYFYFGGILADTIRLFDAGLPPVRKSLYGIGLPITYG